MSLLARQAVAALLLCPGGTSLAHAAQVTTLNTQTNTATGAGTAGMPAIGSFNIPAGKNRAMFVRATFERDHYSNADAAMGLGISDNNVGTGLGDDWPEWSVGTPLATTGNNRIIVGQRGPQGCRAFTHLMCRMPPS